MGKIKNFVYRKFWQQNIEKFYFDDIEKLNINTLPSINHITIKQKPFMLSKWVSPKRTRSYPYARVYNTFDEGNKVVTVIPLIKDEGLDGDVDYLQWDSISLMSLLNVFVIIAYYDAADKNDKFKNKITNQQFNNVYIVTQLEILSSYHQSALHWNLNQLETDNLSNLIYCIKNSYLNISKSLCIQMHNYNNIDKFASKIRENKESFMKYSRQKALQDQNREYLTIQPKEYIGIGEKSKIIIENYLGGFYAFTIDDIIDNKDIIFIIESKHSKNSILPSSDDIKDGLLKIMLYTNICEIIDNDGKNRKFKVVLRLTSNKLKENIRLPNNIDNINKFIRLHSLNRRQSELLLKLNIESKTNNFSIWIQK